MHKKWEEFLKLPETRKREREIQAGLYYDEEKARKRLLNNKWWNTEVYVIPMTKRELAHLGTLKRGSTARYEYIESFKFYNLHYTDYSYFLMKEWYQNLMSISNLNLLPVSLLAPMGINCSTK